MNLQALLFLLLIAGICGSIARKIVGETRGGCLVSIAVGFIGALFGSWLEKQTGLPEPFEVRIVDSTIPVIWSIIGASLFVAALSLISGRKRR